VFGIVIPNYLDVVTNIIFAVFGLIGVVVCCMHLPHKENLPPNEKAGWFVFFAGFMLVSLGSAYYHWTPNNWTLVWDRLPMTLAFMSLYFIAQKYYTSSSDDISLIGNLTLGAVSVLIWFLTLIWNEKETVESNCEHMTDPLSNQLSSPMKVNYMGNRDGSGMNRTVAQKMVEKSRVQLYDQLLPYLVVQFFPITAVACMICTWPTSAELSLWYLLPTFVLYMIAKVLESADLKSDFFYQTVCRGVISGHSLKHLSAGLAATSLIVFIIKEK